VYKKDEKFFITDKCFLILWREIYIPVLTNPFIAMSPDLQIFVLPAYILVQA
jgi:hypothetical protein